MGREFVAAMQESQLWEVVAVYDINAQARELARKQVLSAAIYGAAGAIFDDKSIDAVGLFTLADARPEQIRQALANRKHVLAEKPIGADVDTEWKIVKEIEASDRLVVVNLFNRNAWYHKDIQQFMKDGEIGDLAVIRICHMTPGHMPLEGHGPEGPPFHVELQHDIGVVRLDTEGRQYGGLKLIEEQQFGFTRSFGLSLFFPMMRTSFPRTRTLSPFPEAPTRDPDNLRQRRPANMIHTNMPGAVPPDRRDRSRRAAPARSGLSDEQNQTY